MSQDLFDIKGKKALVTGGAVGLGRACATALALSGADVAIVGRSQDTGERTCAGLRRLGIDSFFLECDVSNRRQVPVVHDAIIQRMGRLDIAINNAGAGIDRFALDLAEEEWDAMIDLNLAGVFWCAKAQARIMARQAPIGGKIINIASMYATIAGGNCAYNAAKAGVVHLTRSLAVEWGKFNINVNCISPGWALTLGNPIDLRSRARMREVTPMGSLLQYKDIYGSALFLASSASDFVTGHDLVVDGGHTATTYLEPLVRHAPARTTTTDEEIGLTEDRALR